MTSWSRWRFEALCRTILLSSASSRFSWTTTAAPYLQKQKGKVDEAVRDGYEIVRGWNVGLRVRSEDEIAPALMDAPCLNIDQYESGRPSVEEACRDGDIRFARFVAKADK